MEYDVNDTLAAPSISSINDTDYCAQLLGTLKTKSAVIRYLTAEGWKRGRIVKGMNIIYQHVRNVQMKELKKGEAK